MLIGHSAEDSGLINGIHSNNECSGVFILPMSLDMACTGCMSTAAE